MAVEQTPQRDPNRKQGSSRFRTLGSAAGLLFVGLLAGVVLGVIWAPFRPGYQGSVEDGVFRADPEFSPDNVEFTSFIWFVMLSGIIGAGVAIVAYTSAGRAEGLTTMLWVGLVATAGAFALAVVGQMVTHVIHPIPAAGIAQEVTLVPPLNPGIGWAVAPFMAVLTYWVFGVVSLLEEIPKRHDGRVYRR